jgi:lipopolysaccharide transport system permease protein
MAKELWRYREVIWSFASRNFRVRYKEAVLGVAWVVIQPLALFIPFVLVFGRLAGIGGGGVPYAAFALSSLIPWQFAANAMSVGSHSLVADANLLRKVYFPRAAPVLGAIGAAYADLAIGLGIAIPASAAFGGHLGPWTLLVPVLVILLSVPILAVSLLLSALNVYYRDVRYALPMVIQALLFVSPVTYPITQIPAPYRSWYALANPFVGPLEGFRRVVALGGAPDWRLMGLSLLSGLGFLLVAARVFDRLQAELADLA